MSLVLGTVEDFKSKFSDVYKIIIHYNITCLVTGSTLLPLELFVFQLAVLVFSLVVPIYPLAVSVCSLVVLVVLSVGLFLSLIS